MSRALSTWRVVHSWGKGPNATVELRGGPSGESVVLKRFHRRNYLPFLRECCALAVLQPTGVVPKISYIGLYSRTIGMERVNGISLLQWVWERFGEGTTEAAPGMRSRIKAHVSVMAAFRAFQESRAAECMALRSGIRTAYAKVHARHVVHNDVKPANIYCEESPEGGYGIWLLDWEGAAVRWDAARRDKEELLLWIGGS